MAVHPDALWLPIPENNTQPFMTATQVILHVRAGLGDSLRGLWNSPGNGLESHFYVRFTGVIEQYVSTNRTADANYTANVRAISVETEGLGPGEWTPAQIRSILSIIRWASKVHGIPLRKCPAHNQPGIGYHIMFGTPGAWTPVAKSCPGPDRIRQFNSVIMPALLSGSNPASGDWFDMATEAELRAIVRNEVKYAVLAITSGNSNSVVQAEPELRTALNQVASLTREVAALKAQVSSLAISGGQVNVAAVATSVVDEIDRRLDG